MKRLRDEIDLTGKSATITMMDLRRHPGEVLDAAQWGKIFTITKAGKKIAILQGIGRPTIHSLEGILGKTNLKSRIEIMRDGSIIAVPIKETSHE